MVQSSHPCVWVGSYRGPSLKAQGRAGQSSCYCGAVLLDAGLSDSMRVFSSLDWVLVISDCFRLCWDSERPRCLSGGAAPAWQSSVQKRGVGGWRPENTHTRTHTHTHTHTNTLCLRTQACTQTNTEPDVALDTSCVSLSSGVFGFL